MEATYVARLREALKAYGYVEGRNLELLVTFTGGMWNARARRRKPMSIAASAQRSLHTFG